MKTLVTVYMIYPISGLHVCVTVNVNLNTEHAVHIKIMNCQF